MKGMFYSCSNLKEIKFNVKELNEYYDKHHMKQEKPKPVLFSHFPREVMYLHYAGENHMFKKDTNRILEKIYVSNMKTFKELYRPNIALLPIGGTYTMDVEHAVMAARWLGVRSVVPMHYGTFPEIEADLENAKTIDDLDIINTKIAYLEQYSLLQHEMKTTVKRLKDLLNNKLQYIR